MCQSGCRFTLVLSSKLYLPAAALQAMCSVLSPVKEYRVEIYTAAPDSASSLENKLLPIFPHGARFIN